MNKNQPIQKLSHLIRLNTEFDLTDTKSLAVKILGKSQSSMDDLTFAFSQDLFVAVALNMTYTEKNDTFEEMLRFIVDPAWDCAKQILSHLQRSCQSYKCKETKIWVEQFSRKALMASNELLGMRIQRCHHQWKLSLIAAGIVAKPKEKPRSQVQVFKMELVKKSLEMVANLKDEKNMGADRILENAMINDGFRTIPNVKKAISQLEKIKGEFENLVEPIDRLKTELTLVSAMKPEKFQITPILLLGEPGIGKTYLADQLAKALGVPREKITAGGAQGGFQLTGSHSTWRAARPGLLSALLAEGKSATPVVVIDEVDKVRDDQYPVLPVLLDVLEPNTGRVFKDEFLEMEFDASRIIFVMTANSLDDVPSPLLSRVEVFDVPRPGYLQRLRIIQATAHQLRRETRRRIKLDVGDCEMLAERFDLDLRKTTRIVKDAFARAMLNSEPVARLFVPKKEGRNAIGFGRTDESIFSKVRER